MKRSTLEESTRRHEARFECMRDARAISDNLLALEVGLRKSADAQAERLQDKLKELREANKCSGMGGNCGHPAVPVVRLCKTHGGVS